MKHFEVTLRNVSGEKALVSRDDVDIVEVLGGRFADASDEMCRKLDIRGGVRVVDINDGGFLARARVRRDFVITHINDKEVLTVADLRKIKDKVRSVDGIYSDGRTASYVTVE